jgi:DNA invertase Pin-like site-specific DNA recombinase
MRVIGYTRVSTGEQAESGLGMEAQRAAIEAAVKAKRWELAEMVEDAGHTAGHLRRPGVQRALDALKRGEAGALAVSRLDRLSRSMPDFAGLMERARREGWAVVILDLGVDTTSANGELVAHMVIAIAQWERRMIGERTSEALAVKRAEGATLGRPASIPAKVAASIRRRHRAGWTLQRIADRLNADGVPTAHGGERWWPSTVAAVAARA